MMYNISMSTQQALMAAKNNETVSVISKETFERFWNEITHYELPEVIDAYEEIRSICGDFGAKLTLEGEEHYFWDVVTMCDILRKWAFSAKCELSPRRKRDLVKVYHWVKDTDPEVFQSRDGKDFRREIVKAIRMDGSGGWSNAGISHVLVFIDKNENEVDITWTGANPTWDALADFLINDRDIQSLVMKAAQYPRRRKIYWKNNSGYSGRWTKTLYEADPSAPSWAPTAGSHKVFQLDVSCFDKVSCIGGSKSTAYRIKAEDLMELFISEIGEIKTLSDLIGGLHTIRKHGVPTRHGYGGYGWWYYEKHCRHWEDVELIERSGSRGTRRESRR